VTKGGGSIRSFDYKTERKLARKHRSLPRTKIHHTELGVM